MAIACSGVILAGGRSTRFAGQDKGLLKVNGKTILDHIYPILNALFEEVLLVTHNPLAYIGWDLEIVSDLFPVRSSLTGIQAALFHASNPYVFITACDVPFLRQELIQALLAHVTHGCDLVVPQTTAGIEPLCAVYARRCLPRIEQSLYRGRYKIGAALNPKRICTVSERILRTADPELLSFCNINTPEDLTRAARMARASEPGPYQ
jgi:molybdopterin-guanine dinucleotide biosynthesis protein A